jgi:hypothetical protein
VLDTAPASILSPALAQEPVEALLLHFSTALASWLSDPHGLVQTGVLPDKARSKYPQLYYQDGKLYTKALYPDENMRALSFFEYDGPAQMQWDDALAQSGYWTYPLAAVVWLNLPAIDPNRAYDFSPELALDFLTRGLLASPLGASITPGSIEQRAERVFARYTDWPAKQQLLMYPYAGFRLPFTVRQRYIACPEPFIPAEAPANPDDSLLVLAAGDIPLGSLVAYNNHGATVLYDAASDPDTQTLYGIATTNGTAGNQVRVYQRPGATLTIPAWGLQAGRTYFAGPAGKLVTSDQGLFFSQVIGRALTTDTLLYQPEDLVILLP